MRVTSKARRRSVWRVSNTRAGASFVLFTGVILTIPLLVRDVSAARAEVRPAPGLAGEVNVFLGTGGAGHTHPAASWPFGMVQVGPDTRIEGWEGCSGYWWPEPYIYGFSHTHLSGTGVGDYCDVLLMPGVGEPRLTNGADGGPGYRSRFAHEREWAAPGYYAVQLDDSGVHVELTATARTALHRYQFPAGQTGHVVLDLLHRDFVLESGIEISSATEVRGFRFSRDWAANQKVFFVLRFSRPFERWPGEGADTLGSRKAAFCFAASAEPLLVQVGWSAVDEAGAARNLDAEQPHPNFEAVRRKAEEAWEKELSRIRIEDTNRERRRIFYTALYHLCLQPNIYSDVDGRYRGRDDAIHSLPHGDTQYTVFSLWDTFRAAHPMYTLLDHARTRDFVSTFLRQYREGGRLPVWELSANETDCMIGYHAVPVMAEALLKGVDGIDTEQALTAMVASADGDRRGLVPYRRFGFIPGDEEGESVSQTLEYAYDDACIARLAGNLGRFDTAARFAQRAQGWKHLFDPATRFFRARISGHWFTPFDPAEVNFNYTEANAWQYRFFVPHDVAGLIAAHGGAEPFATALDSLFAADSKFSGLQQADITGMIGQYAQGNEPSHAMAYLYTYAGQPWKTQRLVRQIVDTLYHDGPEGLCGNEDCGQMSAWYLWSSVGLYPVDPASGIYVLGTPRFRKATIRLASGGDLSIEARGDVDRHAYVQSVEWNGAPLERAWLRHGEIENGGRLVFTLGATADTLWARRSESRPPSGLPGPSAVPAPFVAAGDRILSGPTEVRLGCADPTAYIHYTTDGTDPGFDSARYVSPFVLDSTTVLRAYAVTANAASPVVELGFWKRNPLRKVVLRTNYSERYGAGGDEALVDGLRGKANWRLGTWQGYDGQDLDATVDLGRVESISLLALGALQDTRSWIVYPSIVEFSLSSDGVTYDSVANASCGVPVDSMEVQTWDFEVRFAPREARYVRVFAKNFGQMPDWHPGHGGDAFIFVDELRVE